MPSSTAQKIEIGKQLWRSVRVNEHYLVVRRPSAVPDQSDQAGHAFAGIDRIYRFRDGLIEHMEMRSPK